MDTQGKVGVSGQLGMRLVRADGSERVFTPAHLNPPPAPPEMGRVLRLADIVRFGFPQSGLSAEVNRWRQWRRQPDAAIAVPRAVDLHCRKKERQR